MPTFEPSSDLRVELEKIEEINMRGCFGFLLAGVALAGCNNANNGNSAQIAQNGAGPISEAPSVPLVNASGQIIGEVRGGDSPNGAVLEIDAHGLPPGVHGIHIHDVGICQPPDFKSAGGHWNPTGKQHGGQNPNGAHMGDLQNVTVAQDGTLKARIVVPGTYLSNTGRNAPPGSYEILDASGASVVIHAKPDDYKTDPSGNSGDRIACAALAPPAPGAEAMTGIPAQSGGNSAAASNTTGNSEQQQ
jgi:Cu-Zn family superoxide dismutase